jgi:hypothetical protein
MRPPFFSNRFFVIRIAARPFSLFMPKLEVKSRGKLDLALRIDGITVGVQVGAE